MGLIDKKHPSRTLLPLGLFRKSLPKRRGPMSQPLRFYAHQGAARRSFWWLVRAQLIALVLTVVAFSLFPIDDIAHRYNTARVQAGYLHPSVMIAVKPINEEGMLNLFDLVDHSDPIIREGVKARLAHRLEEIRKQRAGNPSHWTAFQLAETRLFEKLEAHASVLQPYLGQPNARQKSAAEFTNYAMQWY